MDVSPFWNFDDLPGTEARLREALATARGDDALVLRTQIARTLGLRSRFDEAHALLDGVEPQLPGAGAEPRVRLLLERGRAWRSSGQPARARPLFTEAVRIAQAGQLEFLAIDAMHMVALVEPDPQAQLDWNRRALAAAQAAADPAARDWDASLANNIGMALHAQGRFEEALESFRAQLAARERIGKAGGVRIARWMIAWTLRSLRRHDEALALLRSLEREFAAIGEPDGYVFEEIGENLLAQGDAAAARPEFARAHALLSADTSLGRPDAARLARLQELAKAP